MEKRAKSASIGAHPSNTGPETSVAPPLILRLCDVTLVEHLHNSCEVASLACTN